MKSISVIIPTYNRFNTLKVVLPSYVSQACVKEIIVLDDCSSDSTENYMQKVVKSEPKIKYFRNSTNIGQPATQNLAIKKATSDYIFIGEADVMLTRGYLRLLLEHSIRLNADIIAGRRIWMMKGETYRASLTRANQAKGEIFTKRLLTTNCELLIDYDTISPLVDASMLIKREVFNNVHYDEYYKFNAWRQETDFQLNAYSQNYLTYFCPHVHCFHLYKEKDTGGNHSHGLLRYEIGIIKNNKYMVAKYSDLLMSKFGIGNLHMFNFVLYRLIKLLNYKPAELKRNLQGKLISSKL